MCVVGSACCHACCSCCPHRTQTRVPYLIITAIITVLALIMRYWGSGWVINLFWFDYTVCSADICAGQEAVYRLSAALCVFFALHAVGLVVSASSKTHTAYWPFKILGLAALCVIFFVIPNAPFDVYAIIARFVSGFFLLLQIMILIDFAHEWNQRWIAEDKPVWPLFAVTIVLYGAAVVVAVFCFQWFTRGGTSACQLETFFIAFTVCLTGIITILCLIVPHGSLLPTGVVGVALFVIRRIRSAAPNRPSPSHNTHHHRTPHAGSDNDLACVTRQSFGVMCDGMERDEMMRACVPCHIMCVLAGDSVLLLPDVLVADQRPQHLQHAAVPDHCPGGGGHRHRRVHGGVRGLQHLQPAEPLRCGPQGGARTGQKRRTLCRFLLSSMTVCVCLRGRVVGVGVGGGRGRGRGGPVLRGVCACVVRAVCSPPFGAHLGTRRVVLEIGVRMLPLLARRASLFSCAVLPCLSLVVFTAASPYVAGSAISRSYPFHFRCRRLPPPRNPKNSRPRRLRMPKWRQRVETTSRRRTR